MAVYLLGGGAGGEAPFSRTFFNVTLGDLVQRAGEGQPQKLTLFLVDGTTLDVCTIEDLTDQFMTVRAYRAGDDACATTTDLVPYHLVYRIQLAPKEEADARVGFRWTRPAPRG